MSLGTMDGRRSVSPLSSAGRSSPIPRTPHRVEDGPPTKDKAARRYAVGIDRALSSFDAAQQEWADYIAFLARLLKAIQLPPPNTEALPHASTIALRLAQCLNPSLPSGVHQKALEVYTAILTILGRDGLGRSLDIYLPSLLPVPSFASLSVRPLFYTIFEDFILKVKPSDLRPTTKSLILCLLPGIEDETSEDFERAIRIIDNIRKASAQDEEEEDRESDVGDGYFWQCFFLAVITNPSRRQGALAYLARRLPNFTPPKSAPTDNQDGSQERSAVLSPVAEAVITPEPGLLMRCFAAGLQDSQILVQRGFLDLLVTHLPLHSALFQQRLEARDMDLVTSSAVRVVLRRDMSLNRRLWSWFLGPDPIATDTEDGQPQSPSDTRQGYQIGAPSVQVVYFQTHGAGSLQRSIMAMLTLRNRDSSEVARPFRICLSLMDRWEVGGLTVPKVLLPALKCAYQYSLTGSESQVGEVVRSASLFFDGVESRLIWSRLIEVLLSAFSKVQTDPPAADCDLRFLKFVVTCFDIKEEEMLLQHIPNALLILFARVSEITQLKKAVDASFLTSVLNIGQSLLRLLPGRALQPAKNGHKDQSSSTAWSLGDSNSAVEAATKSYLRLEDDLLSREAISDVVFEHIIWHMSTVMKAALEDSTLTSQLGLVSDALALMITEVPDSMAFRSANMHGTFKTILERNPDEEHSPFLVVGSIMSVIATSTIRKNAPYFTQAQISDLQAGLLRHIWLHLSPFRPKYHLEAVRLVWQLESLTKAEHHVEARLAMLVRPSVGVDSAEVAGRFCVLWEHTMQALPSKTESQARNLSRRPSGMPTQGISDTNIDAEQVLARPLLLLLDSLQVESTGASDVIRSWLQTLPSLDRVFNILLSRLQVSLNAHFTRPEGGSAARRKQRDADQSLEDIVFCLQHLRNILRHTSPHTWFVLANLQMVSSKAADQTTNGMEMLALMCLKALALHGNDITESVHHASLTVLQAILAGPNHNILKELRIDDTLIDLLSRSLSNAIGSLQTVYLQTISVALRLRATTAPDGSLSSRRPSFGAFARLSISAERSEKLSTPAIVAPPDELLNCLRIGLSSVNARLYLDHWIDFLDEVLPLYADAVFASLLPLVECICKQVVIAFKYLKNIAQNNRQVGNGVPISALSALLHGLELVLAHVHRLFQGEEVGSPIAKVSEHAPSFFGNMVSGVFANEGTPPRTSRINSRLTMILSFQDAIRTCFSIWAWASQGSSSGTLDPACAATTSLNALKLRNKTRRILEHLFAAEELECLETLALLWSRPRAGKETESAAVFSLLLVLDGSRPKNTVPVIINALYSRTNIDALDIGRRSSLTSDLTTTEVVSFLLSYTRAIEDDATDEIWTECTTFLRDVLSNPLPHRQILPGLLEYTVLLAEKIEHTNFGDLRKMRRDLGDIFLRLLTATFTVRPVNNILESPNSSAADDLISSLLYVAPKLQTVLQSTERVINAADTMSRSVTGPTVHARIFPENVSLDLLKLFEAIAQQSPAAKSWKKDFSDAFYNPRLLTSSIDLIHNGWLPLLRKWSLGDKDRFPELLSRLTVPSTAGIMFGVGANAARLEADRRTQLVLRRAALLLLSCEQDTYMSNLGLILNWLVELCAADASSSPSSTTRAEVFMVFRALMLTFSSVHLSAAWPVLNTALQKAILSCVPGSQSRDTYGNLSLLQACKLLDLLTTLIPDEFQLHEWLYITNTVDAVYRPVGLDPIALADEVAEALNAESQEHSFGTALAASTHDTACMRRPYLSASSSVDGADTKAMARDDFIRSMLQPFLSQLSMYAYEATYQMGVPDIEACKRSLLEDVLDESTMA